MVNLFHTPADPAEVIAHLESLTHDELLEWVDTDFPNYVLTPVVPAIHAWLDRRAVAKLWQRGDIGGALRLQERHEAQRINQTI